MKRSESIKLMKSLMDIGLTSKEIDRRIFEHAVKNNLFYEMEMDSQWVDIHMNTDYFPRSANMHSHEFWELMYCTKGTAPYLIDSRKYNIQPGDVILIPPGVSHSTMPWDSEAGVYQRYVVWLSRRFAEWIATQLGNPDLLSIPGDVLRLDAFQQTAILRWLKMNIRESEGKAPGWEISLIGNTMQVITYIYRISLHQIVVPSEHSHLLTQVLEYVRIHLGEKITVGETAKHFSISESSLSHLFQKEMGIGFYRYVLQQRLVEAKRLIINDLPMEIIAQQVGFVNYSAFYRAFKAEYGISPAQYRKMIPR